MTLPEFLENLEQTPRDWQLDEINFIRRRGQNGDWQCPISALRDKWISTYLSVAEQVGLRPGVVARIVSAADGKGSKPLRAKLLKACGLEGA